MKTLTQVWLICALSSFILLILGFQLGDRTGLMIAFFICLLLIYLVFHKGLQIFVQKTKAQEIIGNDPYQIRTFLDQFALTYGFKKVRLFVTSTNSPPLVWPEFSNELIVFLNQRTLESLAPQEKKIFAHLLLSHGFTHSKLLRRLLGLIYISLSPANKVLSPLFNVLSYALGLSKEIYKADLKALTLSQATHQEFGFFLHKLHHLKDHSYSDFEGAYYFSILSKINPRLYNLKFHPSIINREKNILGYFL